MSYLAAAARANAKLAPTKMVSHATGVVPTGNVVDLTEDDDDNDDDDDDDDEVRVEDVPEDEDNDNSPHENDDNQAEEPGIQVFVFPVKFLFQTVPQFQFVPEITIFLRLAPVVNYLNHTIWHW